MRPVSMLHIASHLYNAGSPALRDHRKQLFSDHAEIMLSNLLLWYPPSILDNLDGIKTRHT